MQNNFYMDKLVMPVSYKSQDWLIHIMKSLGYRASKKGICYGIAHMASQAFLANDLESFNQRINDIYTLKDKNLKKLKKTPMSETLSLSNNRKIKLLDLFSFFDGIILYQSPERYGTIFEKGTRQLTNPAASLVSPVSLDNKENKPELAAHFPCAYRQNELVTFLNLWERNFKAPVSLILSSVNHAVNLNFSPSKQTWTVTDANNLPTKSYRFKDKAELAKAIITFLNSSAESNAAVFYSRIYVNKYNLKQFNSDFSLLEKNNNWQKIQEITERKATLKDSNDANLIYIAAKFNHIETIKSFLYPSLMELRI